MNTKLKLWLVLSGMLLGSAAVAATMVEVTLVDKLDEPRGFCFDLVGVQDEALPENGLQTVSCSSSGGQLAGDQAFDGDLIPEGTFRLIEHDVCMTLTDTSAGSTFALEPCDGSDRQRFEHRANGRVVAAAAPGNCVTAGEGPSQEGQGGDPVTLIRDLTLQVCDASRDARQQWRVREAAD